MKQVKKPRPIWSSISQTDLNGGIFFNVLTGHSKLNFTCLNWHFDLFNFYEFPGCFFDVSSGELMSPRFEKSTNFANKLLLLPPLVHLQIEL